MIGRKLNYRMDDKTMKRLWHQSPVPVQGELPFGGSHRHAERYQARLQVVNLSDQGWNKISMSHFMKGSRPTVDRWIRRFEAEHFARLEDKSRAPPTPPRNVWLPLMIEIYHLQKRHPDAGAFRIWSLLANAALSVRTGGRVMALKKQVYDDIPHVPGKSAKSPPGPHPYKAKRARDSGFIDGGMMDVAVDGVTGWRLMILDGYSRTRLAGTIAPTAASWATLMALYTAGRRDGAPEPLVSDRGGAYISTDFETVCDRLAIDHKTMVRTQGERYLNLRETHVNIQRRWYGYPFSLTQTPTEWEQTHQEFVRTDNPTAHQG